MLISATAAAATITQRHDFQSAAAHDAANWQYADACMQCCVLSHVLKGCQLQTRVRAAAAALWKCLKRAQAAYLGLQSSTSLYLVVALVRILKINHHPTAR
jgi:hypothetical protein